MKTETRRWKVTGTLRGKVRMVFIDARDRNEAVRIASGAGFMLCVRDCVLLDGKLDTGTADQTEVQDEFKEPRIWP